MAGNTLEHTIRLKTDFNVDSIINGFKTIRDEINKLNAIDQSSAAVKEIDQLMRGLEVRGKTLKTLFNNGLTSKDDIETINALSVGFEKMADSLTQKFSGLSQSSFNSAFEKINKAFDDFRASSEEKISGAFEAFKTSMQKFTLPEDFFSDAMTAAVQSADFDQAQSEMQSKLRNFFSSMKAPVQEELNAIMGQIKQLDVEQEKIRQKIQSSYSDFSELSDMPIEQLKTELREMEQIWGAYARLFQGRGAVPERDRESLLINSTDYHIDQSSLSEREKQLLWTGAEATATSPAISPAFLYNIYKQTDEGKWKTLYTPDSMAYKDTILHFISDIIRQMLEPITPQRLTQELQKRGVAVTATEKLAGWVNTKWLQSPAMQYLRQSHEQDITPKELRDYIKLREQFFDNSQAKAQLTTQATELKNQATDWKKQSLATYDPNNFNEYKSYYEMIRQEQAAVNDQQAKALQQQNESEKKNKEIKEQLEGQNKEIKEKNKNLKNEIQAARNVSTAYDNISRNFDQISSRLTYMLSALSIFRTITRTIKKTFQDIQNLDKAFGSIAMVTSMNLSDLWKQYDQYAAIANKLGQQTQSAIEASALYYQQGLQTADVLKLTESTMKLATLAGQDFKSATKEMTAAIRAFNMEMSEGERITDVYSELAAHAAADVNGIATAMSKVASIAASSGSKFENISAFLTQIIETTQEAPTNAGTALKTVIARFSELKEEVDETDAETPYNKMDTALKSVGISLRDEVGQIRAFDEVILELGAIWDTLSRNQQRYIATTAAGSRQQSRFLALMENNKRLLQLIDIAEESSGKSQLQFDKYSDTIEYRINQIKNTWEQFRVSLLDSSFIKKVLDNFGTLLTRLTQWTTEDLLKVGSAFVLLGQTAAQGFIKGIKGTAIGFIQVGQWVSTKMEQAMKAGAAKIQNKIFGAVPQSTTIVATNLMGQNKLFENGMLNSEIVQRDGEKLNNLFTATGGQGFLNVNGRQIRTLTEEQQKTIEEYYKQASARDKEMAAMRGAAYGTTFSAALLAAITSSSVRNQGINVFEDVFKTGAVVSATQSINVWSSAVANGATVAQGAMNALVTGGISLAITALIGLVSWGIKASEQWYKEQQEIKALNHEYYQNIKAIEALKEKEKELNEQLSKSNTEYEKKKEAYDDIVSKGKRLKELYDQVLLTSAEKDELAEISKDLAEIAPELINELDAEGNAIINLTERYDELVKSKRAAYSEDAARVAELNFQLANNELTQTKLEEAKYKNSKKELADSEAINNILNGNEAKIYGAGTQILTTIATIAATAIIGTAVGGPVGTVAGLIAGMTATLGESIAFDLTTDLAANLDAQADDKVLQNLLSDIFADSNTFNVRNKEGKEVVEEIVSVLRADTSEEQGAAKIFKESVQAYANSTKDFESSTKAQLEASKNAAYNLINAYLQENPDFYKADSAEQQAMARYAKYKINQEYDLNNYQALEKQWNEEAKTNYGDDPNKILDAVELKRKEFFAGIDSEVKGFDYSETLDIAWEDIQEDIANLPLNEATEIIVEQIGEGSEQVAAWVEQNQVGIDIANDRAEKIAKAFGLKLKTSLNGQIKTFDEDEALGQVFGQLSATTQDKITEALNDAVKGGYQDNFVNTLKDMASNLPADELSDIIKLVSNDYSLTNSDEAWKDMSDEAKKYKKAVERLFINTDFAPDVIVDEFEKRLTEQLKDGAFAALEKAIKTQAEEGYVDISTVKALTKANVPIEDLFTDESIIDREAAEKWAKDQAQAEVDSATALLEQYKLKTKILESALDELQINGQITEERYRQYLIEKGIGEKEAVDEAERNAVNGIIRTERIEKQIEARKEEEDNFDKYLKSIINTNKAFYLNFVNNNQEVLDKAKDDAEKAAKAVEDAAKKVKKAYEDIIDKQEKLAEAQKKLNETLYGSTIKKGSLDELYNYQNALDSLNSTIEEIKENLEDLNGSPKDLIDQLFSTSRQKVSYLGAENNRYEAAINSTYNSLVGQVNNYMKSIGKGSNYDISKFFLYNPLLDRYEIDQAALNGAEVNSDLKSFIENQIDLMNKYKKNIQNNNKEIRKTEKELEDYRKKARDNYLSVEEEVIKKLEEFYKKQVDDKKEMYDALSEADNKYLDALEKAIDKQRRLRDQQNKWNDLTTQEKRLSLIQRDTSGAQQKEIQKLQKQIEKDRTSMLDTAIDDVVNELKEFYEEQKETREDELKYQESILENASYVAEANAIMQSWKSLDDMRAWMWEHTEGIENMSNAAVDKLTDDWKTMFDSIQIYNELQQRNVKDNFENTSMEIENIISNTTDSLVNEANRAFSEIQKTVDDAIKNAQDGVKNAMEALSDAQEKYNELLEEENKLIEERKRKEELERIKWSEDKTDSEDIALEDVYSLTGVAREEAIKALTSRFYQGYLNGLSEESMTNDYSEMNEDIVQTALQGAKELYDRNLISNRIDEMINKKVLTSELLKLYDEFQNFSLVKEIIIEKLRQLIPEGTLISDRDLSLLAQGNTIEAMNPDLKNYFSYWGNGYDGFSTNIYSLNPQLARERAEQLYGDKIHGGTPRFAKGGLVDYTGPAWVDGTKTRPESFLNSEDTIRIGQAASILRDLATYSRATFSNASLSPNIRESNTEIHIHVDSIATESQVDYLIDRVKEEIVDAANPIGSSVILH